MAPLAGGACPIRAARSTPIGLIPDVEIDIADAALQFARIDAPEANWTAARAHLSELARDMAAMGRGITDLEARASVLTRLLAGRHGYHGDELTYDDLANANLIRVIERRQGMPVALGVIWLHACRAAGWSAHGVDFPGHFLIALAGKGSQVVIDVFNGGLEMEARDLRALIKRVEGENAELRPGVLQPMNARGVLLRLQNNIKTPEVAGGERLGRAGLRDGHAARRPGSRDAVAGGGAAAPADGPGRRRAALL